MTAQTEITQRNHRRAVRFFWCFLIGATTVSLMGNVAHAVLPYLSPIVIQIGAAAAPPIGLLAAVHGIALAVRAGASGKVYCCAVGAVAAIGVGAFALSFLALRDLMFVIGYSSTTAWIFPAIIDTTVAVSTLMLVALGDKPARRARTATASSSAKIPPVRRLSECAIQSAKAHVTPFAPTTARADGRSRAGKDLCTGTTRPGTDSAGLSANRGDTGRCRSCTRRCRPSVGADCIRCNYTARRDCDRGLSSHRGGASINRAAKGSGINYRTARRIVEGAAEHRQRQLVAVG
jgi:Protein of unknown function (DUF2637)